MQDGASADYSLGRAMCLSPMPDKIITENAAGLVVLLEAETDPRRRAVLTDLLIAEENAIAQRRGRCALADALIVRGRKRVRRQRALLSRMPRDAPQRQMAERILENMIRIQTLFEAHRRVFNEDLDAAAFSRRPSGNSLTR